MTTHTPTFDFNLREIQKKTLGKDRSFEPDFNLHQALSELKMKLRIPDSNSALHNKNRELEKISKKNDSSNESSKDNLFQDNSSKDEKSTEE